MQLYLHTEQKQVDWLLSTDLATLTRWLRELLDNIGEPKSEDLPGFIPIPKSMSMLDMTPCTLSTLSDILDSSDKNNPVRTEEFRIKLGQAVGTLLEERISTILTAKKQDWETISWLGNYANETRSISAVDPLLRLFSDPEIRAVAQKKMEWDDYHYTLGSLFVVGEKSPRYFDIFRIAEEHLTTKWALAAYDWLSTQGPQNVAKYLLICLKYEPRLLKGYHDHKEWGARVFQDLRKRIGSKWSDADNVALSKALQQEPDSQRRNQIYNLLIEGGFQPSI